MKLTAGAKKFFTLLCVAALLYAGYFAYKSGYFAEKKITNTEVLSSFGVETKNTKQVETSTSSPSLVSQTTEVEVVDIKPAASITPIKSNKVQSCVPTMLVIPWNAQSGIQYANGDSSTKPGSLMDKHGVKLNIVRQDMYDQMMAEQIKFANAVANGEKCPSEGAAFVIIMGDGYPAYVSGIQNTLNKINQQVQVIGAVGYSRGEDKCMLPSEVKTNPEKAKGSLIGGVKGDGDINICLKWASDNNIPVNPDGSTYDPNALNFVYVSSFVEADDNLIAGYTEQRPVVVNGKLTGEIRTVTQNGTATWTPGDVKVAKNYNGDIASIASTKEYAWQMPSIIIGNKQWMEQNPEYVQGLLAAAFEGGELVRSNPDALMKASAILAKTFNEFDASYWNKYFKGAIETNKAGNAIPLGGSTTNGLGDNAYLFGLNGNDNLYKNVYNVYGKIISRLYPELLPTLLPYEQVVEPKYIQALISRATVVPEAQTPTYNQSSKVIQTFAKKSYSIEFDTGKDTFSPAAIQTLEELLEQLSISGLVVQINGHTDNVGNATFNLELSKKRAEAVKIWLSVNAPTTFPIDRLRTRGFGDSQPIESNSTRTGQAKNRRVEILLQQTN